MNNEQNIDDILKLLRESVNNEDSQDADNDSDDDKGSSDKTVLSPKEPLSADDLSKTLKQKFVVFFG